MRGRIVRAAAVGAVTAGLAWAIGVDAGHVVAFGLLAAAVAAAVGLLPLPAPLAWPEEEPATSGAGWHQVALLAGYLGQVDRDPDRAATVVRRLRALAASRLARAGVAWHSADARRLLGPELHDVLDGRRPPGQGTALVARTLDRLDAIDERDTHDHR